MENADVGTGRKDIFDMKLYFHTPNVMYIRVLIMHKQKIQITNKGLQVRFEFECSRNLDRIGRKPNIAFNFTFKF